MQHILESCHITIWMYKLSQRIQDFSHIFQTQYIKRYKKENIMFFFVSFVNQIKESPFSCEVGRL